MNERDRLSLADLGAHTVSRPTSDLFSLREDQWRYKKNTLQNFL